jgi:NAD(P)-dependent dehydrogenase (short-subunit alcohol dehydrogenase family)
MKAAEESVLTVPRIAIVTGSSNGIGHAVASRLRRAGLTVVGVDRLGSRENVEYFEQADVTDADAAARIVKDTVTRFGRLDVLVNGAGIVSEIGAHEVNLPEWQRVLAVNLTAPYLWSRLAAPHLAVAGGGRIISISSHAGARGTVLRAHYSASKAGLEGMTRTLAVELAKEGTTVNTVAPGVIDTVRNRASHSVERRRAWVRAIPMGRYGSVEDVAAMVDFLASPDAGYVTGQTFIVDGGFLAAGIRPD